MRLLRRLDGVGGSVFRRLVPFSEAGLGDSGRGALRLRLWPFERGGQWLVGVPGIGWVRLAFALTAVSSVVG